MALAFCLISVTPSRQYIWLSASIIIIIIIIIIILDILGAPIGDFVHCSRFIAEKCAMPKILLKALVDVSTVDLHVAFSLLRMCGSYCKLVHLAEPLLQAIVLTILSSLMRR